MNQIALSVGDPASIGIISTLDLIDYHLRKSDLNFKLNIFADKNWLKENALQYFSNHKHLIDCFNDQSSNNNQISFHHLPLNEKAILGLPNQNNAAAIIESLNQAIDFVQSNPNSALVTGAVDKTIIQSVDWKFIGHTNYLSEKFNQMVLMSFFVQEFNCKNQINPNLHIALLSDHCSLKESIKKLKNPSFLSEKIKLFSDELERQFNLKQAKIAILGLNPHAGENGSLGNEEKQWINPIIETLNYQGFNLLGPIAADSALLIAKKQNLDGLISLYHDQLLPVIKYSFFNQSVNITLGLDFIRTSVDHGTAFDIANQPNLINSKPLINAVLTASKMIDCQLNKGIK